MPRPVSAAKETRPALLERLEFRRRYGTYALVDAIKIKTHPRINRRGHQGDRGAKIRMLRRNGQQNAQFFTCGFGHGRQAFEAQPDPVSKQPDLPAPT